MTLHSEDAIYQDDCFGLFRVPFLTFKTRYILLAWESGRVQNLSSKQAKNFIKINRGG